MLKSWWRRAVMMALVAALTACYSTGNVFRISGVNDLVVGKTTYAETIQLLQAEPVNYYNQSNGTFLALWAYSKSVLPDALYIDPQLLLEFNSAQVLTAIKKKPAIIADGEPTKTEQYTGS